MNQELQNNSLTKHEQEVTENVSQSPRQSSNIKWLLVILGILIIAGGCFFVYWKTIKPQPGIPTRIPSIIPEALAERFATYEEVPVNITPQIPAYTVASDLSNTINKDDFELSNKAKELLVKNAFVVVSTKAKEFFSVYKDRTIYEENRYHHTPSFITTDSMLHNYHLAFDHLLRVLEKDELYQALTDLSYEMLKASQDQYEQLKGTEWENAAKRNVAFFMIPDKILYPEAEIPDYVREEVEKELDLIERHEGINQSFVLNIDVDPTEGIWIETPQRLQPLEIYKEDYSQYVPRGHYTKSEELGKYFKAMMWYGRMTFRLKSPDETKSAVLITLALKESADRYNSWDRIYEPTVFFVGKSDDISFYDYYDILKEIYGADQMTLSLVINDNSKFGSFLEKAKDLSPPQINSIPIFAPGIQPDREEEIKGFRFMGQRFTIDASIFQRLMYREVGDKEHTCQSDPAKWALCPISRCLPKGLDIPAAMGSSEALNLLENQGELDYACYSENMTKMKNYIASLDTTIWTQNLYWGWLYSLLTLGKEKPDGYPAFMKNLAWIRKELNAYLGSWTELKRDTILYSKQPMAELGGGGDWTEEKVDDRGYVEPNPYVYARLASLLKMTKEGLQIRNLLSDENKEFLERLETLALSLKTISEKELNNILPTDEEFDLIRTYGGSLEHIWLDAYKDRGIVSARQQLDEEPAPIVADVATDPNGICLEEATGNIFEIYVVVPVEGILRIAKGGVYSHYEFQQPIANRLTDEAWREILKKGEEPDLAEWTNVFIAQ
ncbi:MAG: DUF3160 domain-containing protein [Patescibacteria group bacterium]